MVTWWIVAFLCSEHRKYFSTFHGSSHLVRCFKHTDVLIPSIAAYDRNHSWHSFGCEENIEENTCNSADIQTYVSRLWQFHISAFSHNNSTIIQCFILLKVIKARPFAFFSFLFCVFSLDEGDWQHQEFWFPPGCPRLLLWLLGSLLSVFSTIWHFSIKTNFTKNLIKKCLLDKNWFRSHLSRFKVVSSIILLLMRHCCTCQQKVFTFNEY